MTVIARERVHAMESLAGIIAHELRAGVLGVTSAAQLLRFSVPADPVVEKSLGRILQEAERLSALHEALTEYATELPPQLKPGDPDAVWSSVLRSMRGALEASGVRATHASAKAKVRLDVEQLTRSLERSLYATLPRLQSGAELDVVSSAEEGWWTSTLSARDPAMVVKADPDRTTLTMILCQRSIMAHGGELTEHTGAEAPLLISIRLPLSLQAE